MSVGPILRLTNVTKVFAVGGATLGRALLKRNRLVVHAVANVSLDLGRQEVVGLVGESGCGKSTLGRIATGLIAASSGEVRLDGSRHAGLSASQRRTWARKIQMIFQNPLASLNPRQTIREIVEEPLRVHGIVPRAEVAQRAKDLLERVGLDAGFADRRPHELSGGQCQRVGIARALSVEPAILVCDEPVSALDVSIQAQILNLFADLRESLTLSSLFISHDLGVVERLSDRVAVMYLGRIVELAPKAALFGNPRHPYTQALLDSVPKIGRGKLGHVAVAGERPSPINPPGGCHFHPRCPRATERCRVEMPEIKSLAPGEFVACHLYE